MGAFRHGRTALPRLLLAALLAIAGVAHLVAPAVFERLIPRWVPGAPGRWNELTAAAELTAAGLLTGRRTAAAGGVLAFVTFAGVWVANIQAALDGGYRGLPGWLSSGTAAWVRVPLQLPLLWWAATITRRSLDERRV